MPQAGRAARLGKAIRILHAERMYRESGILVRALVETALSVGHLVADRDQAGSRAKRFLNAHHVGAGKLVEACDLHGRVLPEAERSAALDRAKALKDQCRAAGEKADTWHGQSWRDVAHGLAENQPVFGELYDFAYVEFSGYVHASPANLVGIGAVAPGQAVLFLNDFQPEMVVLGRRVAVVALAALLTIKENVDAGRSIPQPWIDWMATPGLGIEITVESGTDDPAGGDPLSGRGTT